jgi:hypothetical protein
MGISDARKAANARYLAKFERINLTVTAEQKEAIKAAAESVGKSVTSYILYKVFSDTVQDSIGQDTPAADPEPYQIPPEVLAKIEAHREPPRPALALPPDDVAAAPVEVLAQWLHDHGYTARQIREYLKDNRK